MINHSDNFRSFPPSFSQSLTPAPAAPPPHHYHHPFTVTITSHIDRRLYSVQESYFCKMFDIWITLAASTHIFTIESNSLSNQEQEEVKVELTTCSLSHPITERCFTNYKESNSDVSESRQRGRGGNRVGTRTLYEPMGALNTCWLFLGRLCRSCLLPVFKCNIWRRR